MAKGNLHKFTAFTNEDEAIALLESLRWPNGAACPHCGGADPYRLATKAETKTRVQKGLWKCSQCRKKFTVKVGTIFESSHIPVSKWMMAIHLLCASKKGMSAHQFHRMLGITYRAAWFMAHRLRHAMDEGGIVKLTGIVEADETYIGGKRRGFRGHEDAKRGNPSGESRKVPVFALVQRGGGVRAFPVARVTAKNLGKELQAHVDPTATLMTDESSVYRKPGRKFASHEVVKHAAHEYVRGNAHTNTVEGFFSLLKRGIVGSFHHVSRGHLHRYATEFAFRYNNRIAVGVDDEQRAKNLISATEGKRLTFKQPSGASAA